MKAVVIGAIGLLLTPVTSPAQHFGPTIPIPNTASSVAVGDLNRDGLPDLVTAQGQGVKTHLATAPGRFAAATTYPVLGEVIDGEGERVTLADFNRDGYLDAAVATSTGVVVLAGGAQGFAAPRLVYDYQPGEAYAIQVGDFNADQKLDMFAVMYGSSHHQVMSLMGDGTGEFVPGSIHKSGVGGTFSSKAQTAALGDFNGDGRLDAATGSRQNGDAYVLWGLGDGRLETPQRVFGGGGVASVAAVDLDRDGKSELLIGGDALRLWSQGGGSRLLAEFDWFTAVEPGDVDGDGAVDVVALVGSGGAYLARGDGHGGLSELGAPAPTPGDNVDTVLADLNLDGYLDLVAAFVGGDSQIRTALYQPSSDDRLRTSAGTLARIETTVTGVEQAIAALQLPNLGNLSALDSTVSSRASQASVEALAGSVALLHSTISTRASAADVAAIPAALAGVVEQAATQARDALVRVSIEQALARGERLSSFYLPEAFGGALERVRQVVVDELDRNLAALLNVGRAATLLAKGDQKRDAQHYRAAFDAYAEAYQAIVK